MPVVRIIAGHPVLYSLNNGFAMSQFEDGEYYDVPVNVLAGMLERGWAELAHHPPGSEPDPPRQSEPLPPPPQPKDGEPVEGAKKKAR